MVDSRVRRAIGEGDEAERQTTSILEIQRLTKFAGKAQGERILYCAERSYIR